LLIGAIGLPVSAVDPATVMLAFVLLLNVCYLFIFGAYLRIKSSQPDLPRPFKSDGRQADRLARPGPDAGGDRRLLPTR
jgi:ethanolamine permease